MTVGELIAELRLFPPKSEVVARDWGNDGTVREIFWVVAPPGRVDILLRDPVTASTRSRP